MNLFYEDYPMSISIGEEEIPILTDFRDYIQLIDMLNDDGLKISDKVFFLSKYFLKKPRSIEEAIEKLTLFVLMESAEIEKNDGFTDDEELKKDVYSFEYDYPFIFSAFLSEYGINLRTIPYMHWWEFKNLFDGLSEDTEIKKRIMYRSISLNDIKDNDERKRIEKIQRSIRLPNIKVTDYDIADAFGW